MTLQQIFVLKEEIYLIKVGSELKNENLPKGAAYNPNEGYARCPCKAALH